MEEFNLSTKGALLLFLAERTGKVSVLRDTCISYALKVSSCKIAFYLDQLVGRGAIDSWSRKRVNKHSVYTICISSRAYSMMQEAYEKKTNCFRFDVVFCRCVADLTLNEILVAACIRGLQIMKGFRIGLGTLSAYTGLSLNTCRKAVNNPSIAKRLTVKEIPVKNGAPMKTYRFKAWKQESLFLTPYNLHDKIFIIAQELVKRKLASKEIKAYVMGRILGKWDCYNKFDNLMAAKRMQTGDMAKHVMTIFKRDIQYIMLDGVEIHGTVVTGTGKVRTGKSQCQRKKKTKKV